MTKRKQKSAAAFVFALIFFCQPVFGWTDDWMTREIEVGKIWREGLEGKRSLLEIFGSADAGFQRLKRFLDSQPRPVPSSVIAIRSPLKEEYWVSGYLTQADQVVLLLASYDPGQRQQRVTVESLRGFRDLQGAAKHNSEQLNARWARACEQFWLGILSGERDPAQENLFSNAEEESSKRRVISFLHRVRSQWRPEAATTLVSPTMGTGRNVVVVLLRSGEKGLVASLFYGPNVIGRRTQVLEAQEFSSYQEAAQYYRAESGREFSLSRYRE